MNWKVTGRWIALPFGVAAAYMTAVFLNLLLNRGDYMPEDSVFANIWNGITHFSAAELLGVLCGVFVSTQIAPAKEKIVGYIVSGLFVTLAVLFFLVGLSTKPETGELVKLIFVGLGRLCGAILGIIFCAQVYKKD